MSRILFAVFCLLFMSVTIFAQDEFFEPKTNLGGYGELNYNYSKTEGSDAKKTCRIYKIGFYD